MPIVKVWNDNVYPHKERFRDETIVIPPKSFVEMDYMDAIQFKGQYTPIMVDGADQPMPQSFKMIRVEEPLIDDKGNFVFTCNLCKEKFNSDAELRKHSETKHADKIRSDNERREQLKANPKG